MLGLSLALVVAIVGTIGFATTRASADYTVSDLGVAPQYFVGNEDCTALITNPLVSDGAKWDTPPGSGTVYIGSTGVVNFVFTEPAGAGAGQGTHMDWDSNIGIDTVVLKAGNGFHAYNYTSFPSEVYADGNLVTPLKDDGSHYEISHVSFCLDRDVEVSKTADTSYTTTWDWDVEKSVSPAQLDLFDGQSGDVDWTIDVINNGSIDTDHAVDGTITIHNPWTEGASIDSVSDVLDSSGAVSVDCGVTFPYLLSGGGTLECSYSSAASVSDSLNTVSVEISAGSEVLGGSATADVDWGAADVTTANETVTLDDPRLGIDGQLIPNAGDTVVISETLTCDEDEGTQTNVASISTGDSDDASVLVNCYSPTISKTAGEPQYTRTFDWTIEKSVDPAVHDLFTGDSGTSSYEVVVTKDSGTDSGFNVAGSIRIDNPHPSQTLTATLSDPNATTVSTSSVSVPAGGFQIIGWTIDDGDTDPGLSSNTASFDLHGVTYSDTAEYSYAGPTTLVNDSIVVSDTVEGALGSTNATHTYTYTDTFTCDEDEGVNPNVASFIGDTDSGSDNASVLVNCYSPTISKTAGEPQYTRTFDWTIEKSVDPAVHDLFTGDSGTSSYEVVVTKDSGTDSGFNVAGSIRIDNPHPSQTLTATLSDPNATTVSTSSVSVPAGGFQIIGWTIDDGDTDPGLSSNTASFDLHGVTYSDTAEYSYAGPTTLVNDSIVVSDTVEGALGSTNATHTYTYTDTFTCDEDEGVNPNVASFIGDTDSGSDNASVLVNCYGITVNKTITGNTWTKTYNWEITKAGLKPDAEGDFTVDALEINLDEGQGTQVQYTLVVSATDVDSAITASGAITVSTDHPDGLPAGLVISDADTTAHGAAVVDTDNDGTSDPVAWSMSYTEVPEIVVNTASVTHEGVVYDDTASAPFSSTPTTIEGFSADVNDIYNGDGGAQFLSNFGIQTLDGDDVVASSQTYTYVVDFNHQGVCDTYQVQNLASVFASTGPDSANWNVTVNEVCEGIRLTRTPGYWKTHSDLHQGGARFDETWETIPNLDGDGIHADEAFVRSLDGDFTDMGISWFDALSQPDNGSPWNTLARHYAAAYLNVVAGTDQSELLGVDLSEELTGVDVMALAYSYLSDPTQLTVVNNTGLPDESPDGDPWTRTELRELGIKGKVVSEYLNSFAVMLLLAEYLDDYNNGVVGPGAHG